MEALQWASPVWICVYAANTMRAAASAAVAEGTQHMHTPGTKRRPQNSSASAMRCASCWDPNLNNKDCCVKLQSSVC